MKSAEQKSPIVLISCVKSKRSEPCQAQDMYISPLFIKMLTYAQSLKPKDIFILSALYGLLDIDQVISPYEKTLKNMNVSQKRSWSEEVLASMKKRCDLDNDRFVVLAGNDYREYLLPALTNFTIPMEGLAFGQQLKWLKERCDV